MVRIYHFFDFDAHKGDVLGRSVKGAFCDNVALYDGDGAHIHIGHILTVVFSVFKLLFLGFQRAFVYFD